MVLFISYNVLLCVCQSVCATPLSSKQNDNHSTVDHKLYLYLLSCKFCNWPTTLSMQFISRPGESTIGSKLTVSLPDLADFSYWLYSIWEGLLPMGLPPLFCITIYIQLLGSCSSCVSFR